jgi:hypothetical protein
MAQTKSLVRSRLSSYDRLSSTGCGCTGSKSIGKTVSSSLYLRLSEHCHGVSGLCRLRPKMTTVAAIMTGLLPIMWSHGTGSEVMRRMPCR